MILIFALKKNILPLVIIINKSGFIISKGNHYNPASINERNC